MVNPAGASPLRFGPGGIPKLAARRDSLAGIERVRLVGLECMELEFVRRVSMSQAKAKQVKALADKLDVSLSVHAPYYINLNSADIGIVEASKRRLMEAATVGSWCGAKSVAFHAGSYMGATPAEAFRQIKKHLRDARMRLKGEGIEIQLRPETSGRRTQFGTVEEIIQLSAEVEDVMPCIDFAHLHAYAGSVNALDDFNRVLEKVKRGLGKAALADMHIHVSGIRFGDKGERGHINLAESDLNYQELMRALKEFSVGGRLICESPDREADALLLKKSYDSARTATGQGARRRTPCQSN
jgi:deoxyribonuclease-4